MLGPGDIGFDLADNLIDGGRDRSVIVTGAQGCKFAARQCWWWSFACLASFLVRPASLDAAVKVGLKDACELRVIARIYRKRPPSPGWRFLFLSSVSFDL
jgi:hypothetical protein